MNPTDELTGTLVLVHPGLTKDPAGRPGQTGVVTGIDYDGGNAYVGFGKSGQALYGLDALLVLRPPADIRRTLSEHGARLHIQDHTALFRMALLQECNASAANLRTALGLALQSENIRQYGTKNLGEVLGISQEQILEQWAGR